jgi:hypothetical protein
MVANGRNFTQMFTNRKAVVLTLLDTCRVRNFFKPATMGRAGVPKLQILPPGTSIGVWMLVDAFPITFAFRILIGRRLVPQS